MIKTYNKQKEFFDKIKSEYGDTSYVEKIKDYCIGINNNVSDVIGTLDWDHSKEPKVNSKLHQKIETVDAAIDIIKYALNLCIEHDVDAEEFMQRFDMKNRTVDQKLKQRQFLKSDKFKNSKYAFIIDIDGVIADISTAYKNWFGEKTGIKFEGFCTLEEWKIKNIDRYKELKEEYRLSGYKMIMPAVDHARDLLQFCHSNGIVSLLTNRPVKAYPILYLYTVEWLHTRGMIQWIDMLHFTDFGEKRYFFDRFNEKSVYFLEDNIYNLIDPTERSNVENIFIKNETNLHLDDRQILSKAKKIVYNLNDAKKYLEFKINEKNMR